MDSERLKYVLTELNRLLGTNYNLITFDSFTAEQLLQVLTDVLSEVNKSNKIDIRQEELDETTVRILESLRILKYKLNADVSPSTFRQGLIQGEKNIIHPILDWLVTNLQDLQKRSYLAQYLVKLEIPPEMLADPDIAYLYEQYENMINQFKAVHKESELLNEGGATVTELRSDIQAMEGEKEIVLKKIEKLSRRVGNTGQKDSLLEAARNLRAEREREKELVAQEEQQRSAAVTLEQRMRRQQMQLRELRQAAQGATSAGLLRRLEEECSVNTYIAQQKLPQEVAARRAEVATLEEVVADGSISRAHLDQLNDKIQTLSAEINKMVEDHLSRQNPNEDKNAPFRQQAAIIGRKKESKAEQLGEARNKLAALEEELAAKQGQLKDVAGDTVLRGEEFKRYVSKLRGRSSLYKKNRAELAGLKAELGVLTRTMDILTSRDQTVLQVLAREERSHGVEGFRETHDTLQQVSDAKADLDTAKGKTLEEMSGLVVQLGRRVAAKKAELAPLISELRPLREEHREALDHFEQKKRVYDATSAGLENATAKLDKEVEKLKTEVGDLEQTIQRLEKDNKKAEEDLVKVAEEMKLYVSGSAEAKKQCLREQLNHKIAEQEKASKSLKEEQRLLKDGQNSSEKQVQHWRNLKELMECKMKCLEESKKTMGIVHRAKGVDTLILTN